MKSSIRLNSTIDELLAHFLKEANSHLLPVDADFAKLFLLLLLRDSRDGLELNEQNKSLNVCKIKQFLNSALEKYLNPLDATTCSLRLWHFFKHCQQLDLMYVKETNERNFKDQLNQLLDSVLQYPENSNDKQLEEMFVKIQVFIIVNYNIGCPKDHVLLKQTRQSLNSILGKDDLQKYVLKKRYHRLEYLLKLAATVCGILIFNNHDAQGEKEHMRNIFADLEMANKNTKESIESSTKRALQLLNLGSQCIECTIHVNAKQRNVHCLWRLEKMQEISKFVALFDSYHRYLQRIFKAYEKTKYLVEAETKKFKCVVSKINEILKYRSAVESELIFPHFVYLSELWKTLSLYLSHVTEINKVKDHIDEMVSEELEQHFKCAIEEITVSSRRMKHPIDYNFHDIMSEKTKIGHQFNLMNLDYLKDYCTLTLALTNGLLVPAQLQRKLCENSELRFGFANKENAKYAERHLAVFLNTLRNAVFTCTDIVILFDKTEYVIEQDSQASANKLTPKSREFGAQTEFVIENDLSVPNQINVTWNIWDFHRETIRLANLRQRHTHSTQSNLSYGKRNAQNQSYYTREHKGL